MSLSITSEPIEPQTWFTYQNDPREKLRSESGLGFCQKRPGWPRERSEPSAGRTDLIKTSVKSLPLTSENCQARQIKAGEKLTSKTVALFRQKRPVTLLPSSEASGLSL